MANFNEKQAYSFLKVEEYFDHYQDWSKLGDVVGHEFDPGANTLSLDFKTPSGGSCSYLIQIPAPKTIRCRFNPGKAKDDYTKANSRSVVQDTFDKLVAHLAKTAEFSIDRKETADRIDLQTRTPDGCPQAQISVTFAPFSIAVATYDGSGKAVSVWRTADTPVYFTPNGNDDFAVIQAVRKPATARYIGFGEQGGESLTKNAKQSNYFNFDNMRYRQVYDRGPLDPREPLYHSDPFFVEFNGIPDRNTVNGIFIDNVGQILVDAGYTRSDRYMFGTRFKDMDFYLFVGDSPKEILGGFTSIVGRSRLKPRYCLGYHQGCYGYDSKESLEWAAQKYRDHQIPLDGLHVDVDVQDRYHTFTIDTNRFPDPQGMFKKLRDMGVKCSTNITPIISNQNTDGYGTYLDASGKGYLVADKRHDPGNPDSRNYQLYAGGNEYMPNDPNKIVDYDKGTPYVGEVYYGKDPSGTELGTTGHYPDLGRREVRDWWGTQYKYLFETGLEMVWQDMTTPAIRDLRGDMKGFPFRLLLTDDSLSSHDPDASPGDAVPNKPATPAIKIWNLYSYNLHKATYHGLNFLECRKGKRNFIIGRGCFAGSQRWAGLWTGDNSSDWDFLRMNVSQALSLGMCGLDINGQDIGGFECGMDNGQWASPELLIRWTAAGAFLPWFRNHYVRKGRKAFQEPFMYVEWFEQYKGGEIPAPQDLYRMVLPVCKHYIELRYRLMQLFYDAMFSNTVDGLPICRPLFLNDPDDKALYNDSLGFLDNEFFVGKDLLVAPVMKPQTEDMSNGRRDVYLPAGSDWYCFVNNTMPLLSAVEGGTTIRDFDAGLRLDGNHVNFIVPTYVRAGAIIPTIELEQYVGQRNDQDLPNPITLNIYPGADGDYTMYLDDGVSRASAVRTQDPPYDGGDPDAQSAYRQIQIAHSRSGSVRLISVERVHDDYVPKEKHYFVAILHDPSETRTATGCLKSVSIDGDVVGQISAGSVEQRSAELSARNSDSWYYNENVNISFIKVMDGEETSRPKVSISVEYN